MQSPATNLLPSFPRPTKPTIPVSFPRRRVTVSATATVADRRRQKDSPNAFATMYDTLAVAETAGRDDIKAAYRKQARRWHPDTCRSPDEKAYYSQRFMAAKEAYRVLSDPALREDYDRVLVGGGPSEMGFGNIGMVFARRCSGDRRSGFGDWEVQLDGLRRRMARSSATASSSWGSRMRAMNASGPDH